MRWWLRSGHGMTWCWCAACIFKSTVALQRTFRHLKALCLPGASITHVGVVFPAKRTGEADNTFHYPSLFINDMFTMVAGGLTSSVCLLKWKQKCIHSVHMLMAWRVFIRNLLAMNFQLCLKSCVSHKGNIISQQSLPVLHLDDAVRKSALQRS